MNKSLPLWDTHNKNRGLYFDAELVPYCGKTFRVRSRISRFVYEKTGHLSKLKTPAVILEDVWCKARYSDCRMHCPRSIYPWWREIWLERVADNATTPGAGASGAKLQIRTLASCQRGLMPSPILERNACAVSRPASICRT
jgi:hypothetical protein